ncbi:M20 family metallopeptidase [Natranaerobius trueperi]|uniref:Peptidase M20 domain-containing protein 2 n=1 Tax=Natranaerobius trueperi TaxID=759412 RepID=A0A226BY49_9FIRM|nr:M20 family metallopeptidase [Natranaerobius trueperi]OWZ83943.1 amidohydrolase [Natranaerobius trueperi]
MNNQSIKQQIISDIDKRREQLENISDYIYNNPEMGHKEEKAVSLLTNKLEQESFKVEKELAGLKTAFRASYGSNKDDMPVIGILAEYDALPEGHACGHNLIAGMSFGAAVAISKFKDKIPGRIEIYGAPAEETDGAKVTLVESGVFDHLDTAIMAHPGPKNVTEVSSLAIDAIEFTFYGRSAHASSAPQQGINALDAVIGLFNNINALRQQVTDDVRIHGIITEGGTAPNIIPKKTVARFYVRARKRDHLNKVVKQVLNCAKGAATATGCTLEHNNFEFSFDNLKPNNVLSSTFKSNLELLGEKVYQPPSSSGSTDMGNVSHVTPAIHPNISIGSNIAPHTEEFLQASGSEKGKDCMILGAKAIALTAYDLLTDTGMIEKVKSEFNSK